jgi:hypothetical protein
MTETAVPIITMIDATHDNVSSIPPSAPKVAGYVTGSGGIRWTAADWARFSGVKVGINQRPDSDPLLGDVLDVEPGAWTNEGAAQACRERQQHGREINLYSSQDNLTPLLNACIAVGVMVGNLWVANYSLSCEEATAMVVHRSGPWPIQAVQWASNLTLSQGNSDLSVTAPGWPAD